MVLWNNHLGGLSKVTSYQSQSVCLFFFYLPPPLTLSFIRFYLCLLLLPQSLNLSPGFTPALLWPGAPWPVTSERLLLRRWMQLQIRAKTQVQPLQPRVNM